jgi:peptide deformylase
VIRPVLKWPDPVLAKPSVPTVAGIWDDLIRDLFDTMYAGKGCGLAAVQVGVSVRLFVLDVGAGPEVYFNPEWKPWKGTEPVLVEEGCLSVPGVRERVRRYERINVQYQDLHGNVLRDKLRGVRAQAFQHETEHLDGEIFLSRKA